MGLVLGCRGIRAPGEHGVRLLMNPLRSFEIQAIGLMAEGRLTEEQLCAVSRVESISGYEYTGSGYYISIKHPCFPEATHALSHPTVVGTAGEIQAGFVLHIGMGQLTLECHTWGEVDVPEDFRDMNVALSVTRPGTIDCIRKRS